MADVRRIIVIFVIAILFAILVNVSIEAFYPQPEYNSFCKENARPLPIAKTGDCAPLDVPEDPTCKGYVAYHYDSNGCPVDTYCETCQMEYDEARADYNFIVFIISAVAGLIALVLGLYLPQKTNPINEWVGSGFLLGGLFAIAVGTARYFGDMGRYTRPVVILIELILVIYLAYKKLGKK